MCVFICGPKWHWAGQGRETRGESEARQAGAVGCHCIHTGTVVNAWNTWTNLCSRRQRSDFLSTAEMAPIRWVNIPRGPRLLNTLTQTLTMLEYTTYHLNDGIGRLCQHACAKLELSVLTHRPPTHTSTVFLTSLLLMRKLFATQWCLGINTYIVEASATKNRGSHSQ